MILQAHITQRWLRSASLLVMVVASTGYTRIVDYCLMSDSTLCCCAESNACEVPPQSHGQSSVRADNTCFTSQIFGGLPETRAVASSETQHSPTSANSSHLVTHAIDIDLAAKSTHARSAFPVQAPLSTGDICIRIHTLLI